MPTASVQPSLSTERVRSRLPFDPWIPILVLAALGIVAALAPSLRTGPFVDHIVFDNGSDYAFEVSASAAPGGAPTLLGNAAAKGATTVANVFDEGSSWTFRFATQDRVAGEIVVSRDDLVRGGWHVEIPARFAAALASDGVVPTD